MPKATAVWLIENTSLTFVQIAEFCGLHILEVQALADANPDSALVGLDPVLGGQLDSNEIKECEIDENRKLTLRSCNEIPKLKKKSKYTPIAKRHERPDAIAWIIKNYPNVSDLDICRLLGTTKQTVMSIRTKTHWNSANLKPKSPIILGLCTKKELEEVTKEIIE